MGFLKESIIALSIFGLFSVSLAGAVLCGKPLEAGEVAKVLQEKFGAKMESFEKMGNGSLYSAVIESKGKKYPVYFDCDMKYVILGNVIDIEKKVNITKEKMVLLKSGDQLEKEKELYSVLGKDKVLKLKSYLGSRFSSLKVVDLSSAPKEGYVLMGSKNASKVVYVFTDPRCPFCMRFHNSIKKVLKDRKDVAFKIYMYPLPFHSYAKDISLSVLCSKDGASLLDEAFKNQKDFEKIRKITALKCEKGRKLLEEDKKFASKVGVSGTPTFVFQNGVEMSGAYPPGLLEKLIDLM